MLEIGNEDREVIESAMSQKELHQLLRDRIGYPVLIRHQSIERVGILSRVSYRREDGKIHYEFSPQDRLGLDAKDYVAFREDGVWKVINQGLQINWEL